MSTQDAPKRMARILIGGLTCGSTVFKEGDIVDVSGHKDLYDLANGKKLLGKRYAEWVEGEAPTTALREDELKAAKAAQEAKEAEAAPEPTPEPEVVEQPAPSTPADLEEAIKAGVKARKTKTAIVKELGASEEISQRQVGEKFDELLAVGIIVAGETPGSYSVEE